MNLAGPAKGLQVVAWTLHFRVFIGLLGFFFRVCGFDGLGFRWLLVLVLSCSPLRFGGFEGFRV